MLYKKQQPVILLRDFDKETGTYYLRARYYNPATGRFISQDSFAGYSEDPLSLNYYLYCNADPVNRIDPTGFDSYIIYDSGATSGDKQHSFSDEADIREKQLQGRVWKIGVKNALEFKENWNSKVGFGEDGNHVDIDEVVIIVHGSATGEKGNGTGFMYFDSDDGSRLAAGEGAIRNSDIDVLISDLDTKRINSLYFSSCNSGNPDIRNTATAFNWRMSANKITAWDGGTIFNYSTRQLEAGAYGGWYKEWARQHTYYKYVDKNFYGEPTRMRQGMVNITPFIHNYSPLPCT